MINPKDHNGNIRVENYGLAEWLAEIEQVINQGYEFNFNDNDKFPQSIGYMFYAVLVPKNEGLVPKESTEVKPEVKLEVQKRGKLAKVQVE